MVSNRRRRNTKRAPPFSFLLVSSSGSSRPIKLSLSRRQRKDEELGRPWQRRRERAFSSFPLLLRPWNWTNLLSPSPPLYSSSSSWKGPRRRRLSQPKKFEKREGRGAFAPPLFSRPPSDPRPFLPSFLFPPDSAFLVLPPPQFHTRRPEKPRQNLEGKREGKRPVVTLRRSFAFGLKEEAEARGFVVVVVGFSGHEWGEGKRRKQSHGADRIRGERRMVETLIKGRKRNIAKGTIRKNHVSAHKAFSPFPLLQLSPFSFCSLS